MTCIIPQEALYPVYTLGLKVQDLLNDPASNGGLFSHVSPVLKELQGIVSVLVGQSDDGFKMRSLKERISLLSKIVKESSDKSSSHIQAQLLSIQQNAELFLKVEKEIPNRWAEIVFLVNKVHPFLESIPLPDKFRPPVRLKKDIDSVIERVWAMLAVLSKRGSHLANHDSFKIRMAGLIYFKKSEEIPWAMLEQLSIMLKLVEQVMQKHERTSCLLKKISVSIDSSSMKRKESPVQDLSDQFGSRTSSSSTSIAKAMTNSGLTLPVPVSIFSSNQEPMLGDVRGVLRAPLPQSPILKTLKTDYLNLKVNHLSLKVQYFKTKDPSPQPQSPSPKPQSPLSKPQAQEATPAKVFSSGESIFSSSGDVLPKLPFTLTLDSEVGGRN